MVGDCSRVVLLVVLEHADGGVGCREDGVEGDEAVNEAVVVDDSGSFRLDSNLCSW